MQLLPVTKVPFALVLQSVTRMPDAKLLAMVAGNV